MKIAPALTPHFRTRRPAAVGTRGEQLHSLREAGLARAVPPDDKRQTVSGRELERRGGANAAKALNRDRPDVDGARDDLALAHRFGLPFDVVERRGERAIARTGGKDELCPR